MKTNDVKLSKFEKFIVALKVFNEFMPAARYLVPPIIIIILTTTLSNLPFSLSLFLGFMLGILADIVVFGLGPAVYQDLWVESVIPKWKAHEDEMKKKVLSEVDDHLLK